ncbi:efflux RND transporter permease subunit [bacterium]|nr:efflux RND transporter permease subunit [bacterium]
MRLIRWSTDHPGLIVSGYAVLLVLSLLCLALWIPTRLAPSLKSPLLAIVTACPNWTAEEVEGRLTTPLEGSLVQLPTVQAIRSQSMHGLSVVILEFPYASDVESQLAQVSSRLPALPFQPRVLPYDPLDIPVMRLAVHSPGYDFQELRQLLERQVMLPLKQVDGVARLTLFGPRLQLEVTPTAGVKSVIPLGTTGLQSLAGASDLRPALATVTRASQLKDMKIGDRPLSEIARVRLSLGHDSPRYRYNGQEGFEINVFQKPDGSSPSTVEAVRQTVQQIRRQHPGLVMDEAYNNAHFVQVVQSNVWRELALAVALTGLVVYLFLGDLRGTLIALATVPTSLGLALTLFVPLGLSLNSSTLIGLLLALGRLVDDTIIDLHAVGHHLGLGKESGQAAVDGCSEVRPAVLSSTLVLGLAMLPLTWCGGLTQDMFEGIVWPFLLALAASLIVSLTLTPVLAARAYRGYVPRSRSGLEKGYRTLLQKALRQRGLLLGLALSASYLSWLLFPLIGSEMMPLSDTGQIYCELEAQPGTSSEETARLAAAFEDLLRRQPEVVGISTEVGMDEDTSGLSGYEMGGSHMARLLITLTDQHKRQRSLWQIADSVYAEALHQVPGMRRLYLKEMGSDVMASAMAPVQLVIHGPNLKRLAWLGQQTRALGAQMRGLYMVSTSWAPGQPARTLYRSQAGPGIRLATTEEGLPIVLQSPNVNRTGWAVIEHDNLRRSISVMGNIRRGGPGSMKLSMDLQMASQSQLPYPAGYNIEQRGDMTQMMDSFQRLLGGLGAALALIYLALLLQFRNWRIPLVMMATIPLEMAGVFLALLYAGQTFSSVSLLGIVVLHGMDVTAGILLLDSVVRARRAGASAQEALLEGAPRRLRPVLMTVMVTLVVMLPLALFPTTGLDAYAPLATVIVGGLSVSCLLTLGIIPVLYSLIPQQGKAPPSSELA